jgi:hypothetical protein
MWKLYFPVENRHHVIRSARLGELETVVPIPAAIFYRHCVSYTNVQVVTLKSPKVQCRNRIQVEVKPDHKPA